MELNERLEVEVIKRDVRIKRLNSLLTSSETELKEERDLSKTALKLNMDKLAAAVKGREQATTWWKKEEAARIKAEDDLKLEVACRNVTKALLEQVQKENDELKKRVKGNELKKQAKEDAEIKKQAKENTELKERVKDLE